MNLLSAEVMKVSMITYRNETSDQHVTRLIVSTYLSTIEEVTEL
jgi:hypothetical protein